MIQDTKRLVTDAEAYRCREWIAGGGTLSNMILVDALLDTREALIRYIQTPGMIYERCCTHKDPTLDVENECLHNRARALLDQLRGGA